ncbi:MAG: hypothetical protein HOQ24_10925 [Mycobacteriaceae bacterium]|nr:hypothetical protein [Mycobacteriaceae bacterium]
MSMSKRRHGRAWLIAAVVLATSQAGAQAGPVRQGPRPHCQLLLGTVQQWQPSRMIKVPFKVVCPHMPSSVTATVTLWRRDQYRIDTFYEHAARTVHQPGTYYLLGQCTAAVEYPFHVSGTILVDGTPGEPGNSGPMRFEC